MPHDCNGVELKPGDVVFVPARVLETIDNKEFCNVHLETLHPMSPEHIRSGLWLNTCQVMKQEEVARDVA